MRDISRKDHTITFVDTSPSELIHSFSDKLLIFSHINFDNIEIENVKLRQFKETRSVERKLKSQNYIIECFENKKVTGYGIIRWNTQKLALHNASTLLLSSDLITDSQLTNSERIDFAGENISVGHLLSLAWYSVLLSLCSKELSIWTKLVERKEKGLILMDLLPGDSIESSRNLNIVRYIIKNSILDTLFTEAMNDKKLKHLAFGYGSKEGSTKELKNSPPNTVSDWITQSFYCKLRCEKIIKDDSFDTNIRFANLADYLLEKKLFLIDKPFRLVP